MVSAADERPSELLAVANPTMPLRSPAVSPGPKRALARLSSFLEGGRSFSCASRASLSLSAPSWLTAQLILPILIYCVSLYLRYVFFQGFILGDDAEEFALLQRILAQHGPDFVGHLEYRFNIWIFNYVVLSYLGISEPTFFLPTVLMSGSLGVVAYHILRLWRYGTPHAFWGGLF